MSLSEPFTAGPWRKTGTHQVFAPGDGHVIAITYGPAANARLIAAAPELYGALKHIIEGALSLPRFAEDGARAALAKAEGAA